MFLEIVQSVRVSRRAFSHKSEAARSEIYFGSILLTTASGVARNTNAGQGGRVDVVYADHIWREC